MKKILVVDNDLIMLKFMKRLLEKEGHQVVTSEDGLNAIDILKSYTPDVIFVDLVMPNIDGEALCKIVRSMESLKGVYLVVLSAISAETSVDIVQLRADACIAKTLFSEMTQHVLKVLNEPEASSEKCLSGQVFGIESVYPRGITIELLSAKRHLKIILDRMSEGILELNPEGRIVYANPFTLSLTKIPEKTLLGLYFPDVFSGETRQRVIDLLEKRDGRSKELTEDAPLPFNGNQVSLNILPLDKEGLSSIVILDDVTDRKNMESRLQQAQKLESVGTLAGGIAHDFNNLLMGIQGRASLMLMDADASHPFFEHLNGIKNYVKSAADLTKQLLGFARGGKYVVQATDLNTLVKKQAELFARTRKEINIKETLESNLWTVDVDKGQIEQVLLNLYINAWQSMPGGGDLKIFTQNVEIDEYYCRPFKAQPGRYVKISIIDNGVGMDRATREKIFDPFFTTKEMGRGSGLGLASAYGIIKSHGGFINVYSEKGEGSRFNIHLPTSEKEAIENKTPAEEIVKGSETILLVDDENIVMEVGSEMLDTLGYNIFLARTGKEAIESYRENREKINMVILDMIMPDLGGGDTYDELVKIDPDVRVLLSSGYSIDGQASEILERGCDGFIQKPFNMSDLSKKIREILDKK